MAYLEKKNLLESGLEAQIDEEIARGVTAFEATAAADPLGMFDHAYAVRPPHLEVERTELAARLSATAGGPGTPHRGEVADPSVAEASAESAPGDRSPLPLPMRGQRVVSRWQN